MLTPGPGGCCISIECVQHHGPLHQHRPSSGKRRRYARNDSGHGMPGRGRTASLHTWLGGSAACECSVPAPLMRGYWRHPSGAIPALAAGGSTRLAHSWELPCCSKQGHTASPKKVPDFRPQSCNAAVHSALPAVRCKRMHGSAGRTSGRAAQDGRHERAHPARPMAEHAVVPAGQPRACIAGPAGRQHPTMLNVRRAGATAAAPLATP